MWCGRSIFEDYFVSDWMSRTKTSLTPNPVCFGCETTREVFLFDWVTLLVLIVSPRDMRVREISSESMKFLFEWNMTDKHVHAKMECLFLGGMPNVVSQYFLYVLPDNNICLWRLWKTSGAIWQTNALDITITLRERSSATRTYREGVVKRSRNSFSFLLVV